MDTSETAGSRKGVWMRGLIMLVFAILFGVGELLLNLVAVIQFLWLLFTAHPNSHIVGFGRSLAKWLAQVGRFQCVDTEDRPFPWAPWPSPD